VITSETTAPPISLRLPSPPSMMPPVGQALSCDSRERWEQNLCSAAEPAAREGLANQAFGADGFRGFLKRKIRDWIAPMERFIF
jgi:hypothetical protein